MGPAAFLSLPTDPMHVQVLEDEVGVRQVRKRIPDKWKIGAIRKKKLLTQAFWVRWGLCLKLFILLATKLCDSQMEMPLRCGW